MRAEVTKEFKGQGDHDVNERYFVVGEIVNGELAKAAIKAGNAIKVAAPKRESAEVLA